jgi:hypothetical protein
MRSLRDIKRTVAHAPVRVGSKANDAMLEHLLRELSESREDSAGGRMTAGPRRLRLMACLAVVAVAMALVVWRLYPSRAPESRAAAPVASASTSGITLLTEISLERAFRHGGIPAVESQFQRALPAPARKSTTPSFEELLAEVAGNGENKRGTSS